MLGTMQDHGTDVGARDMPHVAPNAAVEGKSTPRPPVPVTALLSFVALAAGLAIARIAIKKACGRDFAG
jgi:hypothetical protein